MEMALGERVLSSRSGVIIAVRVKRRVAASALEMALLCACFLRSWYTTLVYVWWR